MWEFSGLACKTHIAHIAHIARSPGSVEVQRVPADEVEDAGSYVSDFFFNGSPNGPGGESLFNGPPNGSAG